MSEEPKFREGRRVFTCAPDPRKKKRPREDDGETGPDEKKAAPSSEGADKRKLNSAQRELDDMLRKARSQSGNPDSPRKKSKSLDMIAGKSNAELVNDVNLSFSAFQTLMLPEPTMDLLEHLNWDITDQELTKRYRKLSVRIHPDKNLSISEEATKAFDKLNLAYKRLKSPVEREKIMAEWKRTEGKTRNLDYVPDEIRKLGPEAVIQFSMIQRRRRKELAADHADLHRKRIAKMREERRRANIKKLQHKERIKEIERDLLETAANDDCRPSPSTSEESDKDSDSDEDIIRVRRKKRRGRRIGI